jgi:Alpha-L-arabinofuranosidase B, catalytic
MEDASALIRAAAGGDAESLRRLLIQLQRSLRLTAAIFLPTVREVDTTVLRLGAVVASALASAPLSDPVPWVRARLRELIVQRLDALERHPAAANDPLHRLLLSSGRERLATVPNDADPATALTDRLRFMAKGATDLLTLRFTTGLTLAQIADQRHMSLDDLTVAMQTACRQLDWTGDASGGALDPADYRAVDGLVCGGDAVIDGLGGLRTRLLDDMGLALRAVRAARLHLIAAAWHAAELTVELPVLVRAPSVVAPTRRTTNVPPSPPPSRLAHARAVSTPRRQLARTEGKSSSLEEYPDRPARSGLIPTLIGGALVLSGVVLLLLRSGSVEITEPKTPRAAAAPPTTTPQQTATVDPAAATPVVPVVPTTKALFAAGSSPAPLAAWSTRLLVTGYRGPLLRVRRSGDLAESDIAATSSGALDTAAMSQFTSRSSAHVVCWYDQSGNNHHLRQEHRDKQPRIIVDGTVQVENDRPVIVFDRTRFEHFSTPAAIRLGCLYAVVKVRSYGDGAQGLFGSPANGGGERDAYYPIVDRDRKGECEWWVGQLDGYDMLRTPIARDRLLLWHSSSDGRQKPTLVLRLDGKEVGSMKCNQDALVPLGPTVVGCLYWNHIVADPFGGSLGELFVLPPGSSNETRDKTTRDLKSWWKTP